MCQRIPDRRTGLQHWKHGSPRALDSLWHGTISSFRDTDRRCHEEATSATNVHNSERYHGAVAFNQGKPIHKSFSVLHHKMAPDCHCVIPTMLTRMIMMLMNYGWLTTLQSHTMLADSSSACCKLRRTVKYGSKTSASALSPTSTTHYPQYTRLHDDTHY